MGSFANTLFMIMLGWLQGIVSAVWSGFTTENGRSFFAWIGNHWILIAAVLCAVGLGADLAVYLFRWKPFGRRADSETDAQPDAAAVSPARTERAGARQAGRQPAPEAIPADEPEPAAMPETRKDPEEPDLSRWMAEPKAPEAESVPEPEEPATITGAGYVVPADSPYRRPAAAARETPETPAAVNADEEPGPESIKNGPLTLKRRRRISVSELFSDPEEELKLFDAPQQLIDSRKAYREPVYPSGWKKGEEDGQ